MKSKTGSSLFPKPISLDQLLNLLRSRLSPFKHKDFNGFFIVQSLSLIGTWSHDLARAWIVIELMGKASALGTLMLAVAIPSLLLILFGGVVVDRTDMRKLMMVTKVILAVSSLALAFLVEFGEIQMWMLLIFAVIEGLIVSFDSPALQSLVVRLVPRDDLQQALAINSTNFHTGRMLGPLVAGTLMAWHGPALVFLFDAISYILLIFILSRLRLRHVDRNLQNTPKNQIKAIAQGLVYFWQTPKLRYRLLQLYLAIALLFPILIVIFRTFLKQKFELSAEHFGFVFTFPALGSMFGALGFAFIKPKDPIKALAIGIPCSCAFVALVPHMPTIEWATAAMTFTGFFSFLSFASITVSLALEVKEEFRGRLSSLIGMAFISIGPLMSYPVGVYADRIGFEASVHRLTLCFFSLSVLLAFFHWRASRQRKP